MKRYRVLLFLIIAILLFFPFERSFTQNGLPSWVDIYDGDGHSVDIPSRMTTDHEGNVYIVGRSVGDSSGTDMLTLKYSRRGERLLTLRYNGVANSWDEADAVVVDDSDNIYVGGFSYVTSNSSEGVILKYSTTGSLQWEARLAMLDTNQSAHISELVIDRDGNIVAGGNTSIYRYARNGKEFTEFSFKPDTHLPPFTDTSFTLSGIVPAADGSLYVAGSRQWWPEGWDTPDGDCFLLKLGVQDSVEWIRFFDARSVRSFSMDATSALVIGANDPPTIAKYDSVGLLQWSRSYPALDDVLTFLTDITIDNNSSVFVSGYGFNAQTAFDFSTLKFDSQGNGIWSRRFDSGDTTRDFASSLVLDNKGEIYVTGSSTYGYSDSSKCLTIKYDSLGHLIGKASFSKGRYIDGLFVSITDSGDVFVGGDLYDSTGLDYFVLRYPTDFPPILDSTTDMFPLTIGRQWVYDVDWNGWDAGWIGDIITYGSGRATITVVDKFVDVDSTRWILHEIDSTRWCSFELPPAFDTSCYGQRDTTEIILIEKHDGKHQLYRVGYYDNLSFWASALPFGKDMIPQPIYRYQQPFVSDTMRFTTQADTFGLIVNKFVFVNAVGVIAETCIYHATGSGRTYKYQLRSSVVLGVTEQDIDRLPREYILSQNYPNPFNPSTSIEYILPRAVHVRLSVFNLLGQEVAVLVDDEKLPGRYTAVWNATTVASGVYFYRLVAISSKNFGRTFIETHKMLVLK